MSEERLKVLEMLAQGKITVADAEQLLKALRDTPAAAAGEESQPARPKGRKTGEWEGLSGEMEDLQEEIQERIAEARQTIRESMPKVKQTIRHAMPEVDRMVRDAMDAIPDVGRIVRDAVQTASQAVSGWPEHSGSDDARYPEQAEREVSETLPAKPGDRVALRNPRGHILVETWDREEVQADVRITVRATRTDVAQAFAEQIRIETAGEPGVLRIQPIVPERRKDGPSEIGPYRVDIHLHVPGKVDLDLRTAHGDIGIPQIDGAVVLHNRHGKTTVAGASGDVWLTQSHGPVNIGQIGSNLTLDVSHGNTGVETVGGAASVQVRHGSLELAEIAKGAKIDISHGKRLKLGHVGEDAVAKIGHTPAVVEHIGGNLTVNASHCPVSVNAVAGNAQAVNSHGPIEIGTVGRDLVVRNSFGPIHAGAVGGNAVAQNRHGPIGLDRVGGSATVENSRGPITLGNAGGKVVVRADRGAIEITAPAGEVVARADRSNLSVRPNAPVRSDYTLQCRRGNATVLLPDDSAVDVRGYVRAGRVHTDLPLDVSEDPRSGQSVSGRLNGGGARITVEVDGGNLNLSRGAGSSPESRV